MRYVIVTACSGEHVAPVGGVDADWAAENIARPAPGDDPVPELPRHSDDRAR